MLDSRNPPAQIAEEERLQEEAVKLEVQKRMREVRLWRIPTSAMWIAWGIVQAKVPGMAKGLEDQDKSAVGTDAEQDEGHNRERPISGENMGSDPLSPEVASLAQDARDKRREESVEEEDEEDFDYLRYAQDRARLFWGDLVTLGFVKKEDLPAELVQQLKILEY